MCGCICVTSINNKSKFAESRDKGIVLFMNGKSLSSEENLWKLFFFLFY